MYILKNVTCQKTGAIKKGGQTEEEDKSSTRNEKIHPPRGPILENWSSKRTDT